MSLDFSQFANWCSGTIAKSWFFITNTALCILVMVLPGYYTFSIALISVITYLIAILIQRTQNEQEGRMEIKLDSINEKLDEIIRSSCANNHLIGIEKGKLR